MQSARLPRILGAVLYDLFLVCSIIFIAAQWFPLIPEALNTEPLIIFLKQVYILGIAFLYFAWSWRRGGQTIGMKAWHLRLVNANAGDAPVSWRQCLLRYLVAIVSWICLGLGFLWILFEKQHRSWHDLASETRLLRLPKAKKTR